MSDDILDEAESDRSFVTALARGLDVLRCFGPDGGSLTNQEIAARTGLPKPTVSRLTYTLRKLDYLVFSERSGSWRLGPGVLALGYGALSGMEMGVRAEEDLRALATGPNRHVTAALAERDRLSAVYTAIQRSQTAVALTINVGARLPLMHSAVGRALLVGMPETARDAVVAEAIAAEPDQRDRILASRDKALEDFARFGWCTGFGEWREEVNGIAVPVTSLDGERLYGLNVGGPSFLVPADELQGIYGEMLLEAARNLTGGAGA